MCHFYVLHLHCKFAAQNKISGYHFHHHDGVCHGLWHDLLQHGHQHARHEQCNIFKGVP